MGRLTMVMVVRDEATLVERALTSARDHVDDLVVLDVGSSADTLKRVRACGARVVRGTWSADRASVRNAALAASDADWNLVLDPGEWLDAGGTDLRRIARSPADRVGLAEVVRGPGGPTAQSHPIAWSPRVIPRGTRYAGAVHEEVIGGLPTWQTELLICSDGADAARWRTDVDQVEAVLLQGLAVRPDEPYLLYQLAGRLRDAGRQVEAAEMYVGALGGAMHAAPWRHALVVEALQALTSARRFRDAAALVDAERPHWQHSPDFSFAVGDLFFEMLLATPALAPELVPIIETSWRRCIELGDRPELAGTVHGRGSFLAAQNLYVLHLTLGHDDAAQAWLDRANELRMASMTGDPPRLPG